MADGGGDTSKDQKTEEPTEKRIRDALLDGNTPVSRELPIFASLVALLVILSFLASAQTVAFVTDLSRYLDGAGNYALRQPEDALALLAGTVATIVHFTAPFVAVLLAGGIAAALVQNPPRLVLKRIRPQASRIGLISGFKRVFGVHGQVEFLRSLFKFLAVGLVCVVFLRSETAGVLDAIHTNPHLFPSMVLALATKLVAAVCVATICLVAADLVWSRHKWRFDLRMTRQELKDEMKQAEGDPIVRARLRSLALDRSRRQMLRAVSRATLVIANPTHYALALHYERNQGGAPLVLAKGTDLVALRIRGIAEDNGIPVIEDPLLARALYHACEVDQWIPPEFYRAVAQILHFIYSGEHAPR